MALSAQVAEDVSEMWLFCIAVLVVGWVKQDSKGLGGESATHDDVNF